MPVESIHSGINASTDPSAMSRKHIGDTCVYYSIIFLKADTKRGGTL